MSSLLNIVVKEYEIWDKEKNIYLSIRYNKSNRIDNNKKMKWLTICLTVNYKLNDEIVFTIAHERQLSRCSVHG